MQIPRDLAEDYSIVNQTSGSMSRRVRNSRAFPVRGAASSLVPSIARRNPDADDRHAQHSYATLRHREHPPSENCLSRTQRRVSRRAGTFQAPRHPFWRDQCLSCCKEDNLQLELEPLRRTAVCPWGSSAIPCSLQDSDGLKMPSHTRGRTRRQGRTGGHRPDVTHLTDPKAPASLGS